MDGDPVMGESAGAQPVPAARPKRGSVSKTIPALDDDLISWIADQPVFFVATAPDGPGGHVNLSPKGHDTFRVLDPLHVAYLDLTGSGAETIAHLRQNGRITVMFAGFAGPPRIVRMHGQGTVHELGSDGYRRHQPRFDDLAGARAIIEIDVERLSTSCGYAVPFLEFAEERPTLLQWAARKSPEQLEDYRAEKNATSIDGLPAFSQGADPGP